MPEPNQNSLSSADWPGQFFRFLSNEKDASVYTQRNYQQALNEFEQWYRDTNESPVRWSQPVSYTHLTLPTICSV